eukprot:TRINITY_DN503_c5_g1_i1.p1 TRINITY_DN503_c5_g1~~TRINITY_DN503_c5_g1_i1.p1  ORF type:complete len:334 (-),score=78.33 TRINITY_DN503_c5_g1_i1:235-1164(-)
MASSAETWRSKLNNKYGKQDIEKWEKSLKATLAALRQNSFNRKCFDCGSDDTTWASPKLGIFICVSCSDVHRAAGAHITCVKNFNTYLWGPDEVELMKAVGNKRGKEIYGDGMVAPSNSKDEKVRSCTKKYGDARVQELVKTEIAAATSRASNGPGRSDINSEPVAKQTAAVQVTATAAATSVAADKAITKVAPAFADNYKLKDDSRKCAKPLASPLEDDLDDFFARCIPTEKPADSVKPNLASDLDAFLGEPIQVQTQLKTESPWEKSLVCSLGNDPWALASAPLKPVSEVKPTLAKGTDIWADFGNW